MIRLIGRCVLGKRKYVERTSRSKQLEKNLKNEEQRKQLELLSQVTRLSSLLICLFVGCLVFFIAFFSCVSNCFYSCFYSFSIRHRPSWRNQKQRRRRKRRKRRKIKTKRFVWIRTNFILLSPQNVLI